MKFDYIFKHIDVSEALVEYARKCLEKLEKFELKPTHVHWVFSIQRHRQTAEIIVMGGQKRYVAEATGENLYAAVDDAIDKMGRQLHRKKDKVQYRRKHLNRASKNAKRARKTDDESAA